ncbi:MAG: hypothetical protein JNK85_16185 [Verrucomicrobiales bacterium]|nr:hypothetical protein [Verrucomicrobiales bacterium]
MNLRASRLLTGISLAFAALVTCGAADPAPASTGPNLRFQARPDGSFVFNTGTLRGVVRTQGKSVGLQEVYYLPTKQRLDRSMGLLGHYRVFSQGKRYGTGAWDWPSTAQILDDGTLITQWAAGDDRPFELRAAYRWRNPSTLDVETMVRAQADLPAFECFLASYFAPHFSQASIAVGSAPGTEGVPQWLRADRAAGDWQIFPRDSDVLRLIQDGRWKLEPNPVAWVVRPSFDVPMARRRSPNTGLSAILMAPAAECFALSTPHETEEHNSTYLSLFGINLKPGVSARARVRLVIAVAKSDPAVRADYDKANADWAKDFQLP